MPREDTQFKKGHLGYKAMLGKKLSEEHKQKLSDAKKGKILSEEHKIKIGLANKGKKRLPFSAEHRHKISNALKGTKRRLGTKHSEEAKRKMSLAHKGKSCSEETRKKMSESRKKRPPFSEKTRKKMSKSNRGNKSHFWKGGITLLSSRLRECFKYRQWRSDVFTRDNFTCQECGIRGGNLEAHHCIEMFSVILKKNNIKTVDQSLNCEELWNINNGITLCLECHNKYKKGLFKK